MLMYKIACGVQDLAGQWDVHVQHKHTYVYTSHNVFQLHQNI